MNIRDPRYIEEARQANKKINSRKSIRSNAVKSKNVIYEDNETFKCDILPMKAAITTVMIAQDIDEDDDCTLIQAY